jgi:hypothetical protein
MATLFFDCETPMTKLNSLSRMTLHQYFEFVRNRGGILGFAWAIDDDAVNWNTGLPSSGWLEEVANFLADPSNIFVAHNAAFDCRVLTDLLGLPQPARVRCSLELAYAAWPNQPGAIRTAGTDDRDPHAYSLASLAQTLALGQRKLDCDLETPDPAQLAAYCKQDVTLCRMIYQRAIARLTPEEIRVSELANQVREIKFDVALDKVNAALVSLDGAVANAALAAIDSLGDTVSGQIQAHEMFGVDKAVNRVRSVKVKKVKQLLLSELGFDTTTISYKKLNPSKLAASPKAATLLKATTEANKSLSHRRRVGTFAGITQVHAELGYARAHTFRYSSPSVGKGLNLHNIPKRNKVLAKAIRSMFSLPEGFVWVRADLSNVEYRGAGFLAQSAHVLRLFSSNGLADPYVAFWEAATGQAITKKDPARQVAKAAVLGLSYLMGLMTWMNELMKALADPEMKLTLDAFQQIADSQGWFLDTYGRGAMTKTNCPEAVARVAQGTHRAFHTVHPELRELAQWLECVVTDCARALDPAYVIDMAYQQPGAPDRRMVDLQWEDTPDLERSVRVRVGDWTQPTVTWRDVGVRFVSDYGTGMCLSSRQSGSKGYRPLTKNILIENLVQAWARNALVKGKLELDRRGYPYILSVHDELLLAVPADRDSVLRARNDLLEVFGPHNQLGYEWACTINPDEINVSKTLFEQELGVAWWERLRTGDVTTLQEIP